jgi:hypothetical protein
MKNPTEPPEEPEELTEADWVEMKKQLISEGSFTEESADRILRLLKMESTPEEKARWIGLGIMSECGNHIYMPEDMMENGHTQFTQFVLWDLSFRGEIVPIENGLAYRRPEPGSKKPKKTTKIAKTKE